MVNLPNLITILRVLLVPVVAWLLVEQRYGLGFLVFVVAALSDFLDGVIARRTNQTSTFGATLDPLADKAMMVVTVVLLAWRQVFPVWLTVAIIARDVIIVGGAVAYRFVAGQIEITPSLISKFNTLLEFVVVSWVLAQAGGLVEAGAFLPTLYMVVLLTIIVSGVHYMWVWGWKAAHRARQSA